MCKLPIKAIKEFQQLLNATGIEHSEEEAEETAESFMLLLVNLLKTQMKKSYNKNAVT